MPSFARPFLAKTMLALCGAVAIIVTANAACCEPVTTGEIAEAMTDPAADNAAGLLDFSNLTVDPADFAPPSQWRPSPRIMAVAPSSWDRKDNKDGSSALTVRQSLPTAWDSKIGVDLSLAPQPTSTPSVDQILSKPQDRSTGAAWGRMEVSGASFDARLDPAQEQTQLGTRLSKSLAVGDGIVVTVQNGYSLTNTLANSHLGTSVEGRSQILTTDREARVNILPTGTSLIAGTKMSSADDKWLNQVGAEQKLFDSVSIRGTVSETLSGATDKSITAGFKKTW